MSSPVQGSAFLLKVETAPAVFTVVEGMNQYNKQRTRSTQPTAVFNRTTPWLITQPKEENYSVSGLYMPGDPGQVALRAAELAQTAIVIQVLPDGIEGFSQSVLANSHTHDASPDGFQEITWEFAATADAVVVGAGDLL